MPEVGRRALLELEAVGERKLAKAMRRALRDGSERELTKAIAAAGRALERWGGEAGTAAPLGERAGDVERRLACKVLNWLGVFGEGEHVTKVEYWGAFRATSSFRATDRHWCRLRRALKLHGVPHELGEDLDERCGTLAFGSEARAWADRALGLGDA